ncbi:hypothetical protein MRB53_030321 [Persea americana]|uniref:Uncharacterized protein n=1 Tax=Persea americana TaxID=3435 RepID=A0ACC2KKZ8_PERAE|nr:hypothetical protein MRB53_030321 [Persea americana]
MATSSFSPSPKMIKLVSKEWQEFIVEESVAKVSGFIKESIYHGSNIITLDNTKTEVLEKGAVGGFKGFIRREQRRSDERRKAGAMDFPPSPTQATRGDDDRSREPKFGFSVSL